VTNDGLAELLVMAAMLVLLTWMHEQFGCQAGGEADHRAHLQLLLLGILIGLGLLTKIYAYALLPLCALTVLAVIGRKRQQGLEAGMQASLWVVLPVLLLGLPLWLRNWRTYGAWDLLGTRWHDQVVAGQPRTAAWIAEQGFDGYLERAISFTFRSFWGVFGWLGIFLDERIYTALLLFTGVLFLGLLWAMVRLISAGPDMDMDDFQLWVLGLFAAMVLTVLASYVWYNLKFVQHQGRYLFWGLLPISAFVGLAWREVLRPLQGLITGILLIVLTFSFLIVGYVDGEFPKWTILTSGLFALYLLCQSLLFIGVQRYTNRWSASAPPAAPLPWLLRILAFIPTASWALPFVLLAALNLLIPTFYILPQLQK
jgi:hypothetical protein